MSEINKNEQANNISNKKLGKNVKLIVIIALLLVFAILIPIGYSLFSDTKTKSNNETVVGTIAVELKEDWPNEGDSVGDNGETYDEFGLNRTTKKIYGKSTGNLPAYVRVRTIPIVEYYVEGETAGTGSWVTVPVSQDNIIITVTPEDNENVVNWIQSGDYWYYKNILPAGEQTPEMGIRWQVAELPSELEGHAIRTNVRVMLEYAQTTHDMWKSIFQIDSLPQGVEGAE